MIERCPRELLGFGRALRTADHQAELDQAGEDNVRDAFDELFIEATMLGLATQRFAQEPEAAAIFARTPGFPPENRRWPLIDPTGLSVGEFQAGTVTERRQTGRRGAASGSTARGATRASATLPARGRCVYRRHRRRRRPRLLKLDRSGLITGKSATRYRHSRRKRPHAWRTATSTPRRAEIGSLDHVTSILKVFGMVNVAPGFGDLATVLDGCTDQLTDVFGDDIAIPARVTVGVAELPLNAAVETEMIVAVRD